MPRQALLALTALALLCAHLSRAEESVVPRSPAGYVDMQFPGGLVFRGADVPWGMMMWGPSAYGFSITSLSGSEMDSGYSNDLPILPVAEPSDTPSPSLQSPLVSAARKLPSNRKDQAEPGYFYSRLPDGITVNLTATARTGIGTFLFPPMAAPSFLFHFDKGPHSISASGDKTELFGSTDRNGRTLYFVVLFDRPFVSFEDGKDAATATFDAAGGPAIRAKVGMSFVRVENARLNLSEENPDWDFDGIRAQATALWNKALSRVRVEGGTREQTTFFYTLLSHCLFHPNVFSDVNGEYLGFDWKVHKAVGYVQYANFSGWDIYRSWMPLIAWLFPKEASDMMQSLVADAEQGGGAIPEVAVDNVNVAGPANAKSAGIGGMPRWPVHNIETGTMEAGSATPIVAGAYAFGARRFDTKKALEAIERVESRPGTANQGTEERWRLKDYLDVGYLPVDMKEYLGRQTAAMTLEYAVGDFAASRYSSALGYEAKSQLYLKRAQNWKNIFNAESGYIQPRERDGSWWKGFDPAHGHMKGFTEGNSAQYSWMVPHNLRALIEKMRGDAAVVKRLDDFFSQLNAGQDSPHAWIGNEPSFGVPWVYNSAAAPWRTQNVVRRIVTEVFMRGLPGADDLGAMSSWGVWACLGLYPSIPGVGGLTVGSPLFPKVTVIHGEDDQQLRITGRGASAAAHYVRELILNGKPYGGSWIPLSSLEGKAVELIYSLSDKPSLDRATKPQDAPPSFDLK